MRETDSFAFGPSRQKEKKAARPPRVRPERAGMRRLAAAIVPAPLLLLIMMVAFAVAWPSLALVLSCRGVLRSLTLTRSALVALTSRAANARRASAGRDRIGAAASVASRQRAPRVRHSVVRSRNLRRATTAFAVAVSFLMFGGVVPVSAAPNDITTVAGRPDSGDGGAATGALMHRPGDVATDASGNVFIADTYNHRIRRVSATGTITTVAGNGTSGFSGDGGPATSARLRFPEGVWVDPTGNLYIADSGNNRVRKVDTSGTITTVAGNGIAGSSGDGGPATAARLNDPRDITTGGTNLYIADGENNRIRRVQADGTISTFAGNGIEGYAGDGGAATSARLNDPTGVAYDASSSILYISDTDNHRIRQVGPSGTISTFIGTGSPGDTVHPRNKAQVDSPQRIAMGSGGLYIADTDNDRVRFISFSGGNLDNAAGNGIAGFSGDGGSATSAQLREPTGVAFGASSFFVADSGNHRIRRATFGGTITTYAGKALFGGDGGPGVDAALNSPYGLTTDNAGTVYIADTENHRIRRLSGGTITTIGGSGIRGFFGDGGAATSAQLDSPYDVAADAAGNVYVADTLNNRVRMIDAGGTITTVAGTGTLGFSGDGGAATSAQLYYPIGLDIDASGNLYIADYGNHRIRRVSASGTITTVAGNGIGTYCGDGGAATSACLENPADTELDGAGNLYIADYGNSRVRKVTAGTIRTVAGNGSGFTSGDGGAATSAGVPAPVGVGIDAAGNLFIASSIGGRIRKVDLGGTITTVAGNGSFGFSGDGGPATSAQLAFPARVTLDPAGNFFIADVFNNRIRMVEGLGALPGPTMGGTTPNSPASDNAPLVYGTAEPATTVRIYTSATCTGPVAATGTDAEFASPGLAVSVPSNSTTTFYATATDTQGRTSACSMTGTTYIEDSTPPASPTITLAPSSPGSDTSPSWTFTTEAGATTECELARGGTVLSPYGPCTSPFTADLTGEPDGSYTFSVRATDAAGNLGMARSNTYVLDSTQPGGPTITSSPPTPSNDPGPTWEFTVEPGSTAECEFSYEGVVLEPFAPCTGPQTHDLSGEPDGDYTFRVQARDGAGNPSAPVDSVYTYDTTEPGAPTIDTAPTSPGNSTSPTWEFTVEAGSGGECELRRGGVIVSAFQPCASPESYSLGGEPDGSYEFSVRAVDAAGNTGAAATDTYILDTTGPDASIVSSPSSPDSATDPSWTFSTEPGATTECELRHDGTVVSPWSVCAGPATYDLSGGSDGAYTFSVRATDDASNTGDPASSVYVLDTTAPVVSIDAGPAAVSSERNPEWDFTSEPGVTTECQLSSSAGVLQAFTPCTSPRSYDLTGQPDDTYTFSVQATDPAGNLGPASSSGYYLDTTGPTSSITASPTSPGNNLSPSWGFTAEPGATTECELTSGGTVLSAYASCTSPTSYSLSGQPDGSYTFSVRATDAAGNVGASASDTYTLDTTAPAAPAITSAPSSPSSLRTPSWSFTAEFGATTQCELSRGGAVLSGWGSCSSPHSYSLSGQPDGDYVFRVRAVDGVGNAGASSQNTYTLDTTAPNVNISSPGSPGSDRTPSWTFSTEAGASTDCQLSNGAGVLQPFASCTSPVTYDLSGQPDGGYTISVRGTDAAGNSSVTDSSTYVLDTAGPDSVIVAGQASPGNNTSPSWSFSAEAGATTECQLTRGPSVIHSFAPCSGSKTYDIAGEPDGAYTLAVRATDAAGNVGSTTTDTYTLNTTVPATPIITAAPASPGLQRSVAWSFSAEGGATTECELVRGTTTLEAFGSCASPASYSLNGEPDGAYSFRVRAVDEVGNLSASASSTYDLDTTGPGVTITSAPSSPDSQRNPTWSFTTEAGATSACSLSNGASQISPDAPCVSPASFDLNGQPDGTYTLRVSAVDQLGNAGPAATSTYVLVTAPGGGGGNGGDEKGDGGNDNRAPTPDTTAPVPEFTTPTTEPVPEEPDGDGGAPAPRHDQRPDKGSTERGTEKEQEIAPTAEEAREATARSNGKPGVIGEVFENVSTVVTGLLEEPAFPMILISLVVIFLVLQNRVDRRDPKLALAPVFPDPHLYFNPQDQPQKDR